MGKKEHDPIERMMIRFSMYLFAALIILPIATHAITEAQAIAKQKAGIRSDYDSMNRVFVYHTGLPYHRDPEIERIKRKGD